MLMLKKKHFKKIEDPVIWIVEQTSLFHNIVKYIEFEAAETSYWVIGWGVGGVYSFIWTIYRYVTPQKVWFSPCCGNNTATK